MTVAELEARMSSAELSEWQAFIRLEHEEYSEKRRRAELGAAATAGVQARKTRMRRR